MDNIGHKKNALLNTSYFIVMLSALLCVFSLSWVFYQDYVMFIMIPMHWNNKLNSDFYDKELIFLLKAYLPILIFYIFTIFIYYKHYKSGMIFVAFIYLMRLPNILLQTFKPIPHLFSSLVFPARVDGAFKLILVTMVLLNFLLWIIDLSQRRRQKQPQHDKIFKPPSM